MLYRCENTACDLRAMQSNNTICRNTVGTRLDHSPRYSLNTPHNAIQRVLWSYNEKREQREEDRLYLCRGVPEHTIIPHSEMTNPRSPDGERENRAAALREAKYYGAGLRCLHVLTRRFLGHEPLNISVHSQCKQTTHYNYTYPR